jgi:hypothetical protein
MIIKSIQPTAQIAPAQDRRYRQGWYSRHFLGGSTTLTVEGVFKLFIFYLDDGYVIAKHAVLIRLGELLAPHGILLDDLPSPGISSSHDSASTTQVLVETIACSAPRHLHNWAHDSGAHLNMAKSPAWWPTAPSADILQKYEAAGVPFLRTEGVLVLKVPVGSDTYVRTQLVNKVEELRTRIQVLEDFQETQAGLLILRDCMGVCLVNSYFACCRNRL